MRWWSACIQLVLLAHQFNQAISFKTKLFSQTYSSDWSTVRFNSRIRETTFTSENSIALRGKGTSNSGEALLGGIPPPTPFTRYTSRYWFSQLINLPHSRILDRIKNHLLWSTLWSAFLTFMYTTGRLSGFVIHNMVPWSILASVLSLLLVFRTNSAYDRFWEGKKLMTQLLHVIRLLCMQVNSVIEWNTDETYEKKVLELNRRRFASLAVAFLPVLLNHLAYEKPEYLTEQEQQTEFTSIFNRATVEEHDVLSPSDRATILGARNRPLRTLQLLINSVSSLPVGRSHDILWNTLGTLNEIVAGMERIVRTPVPMSYSRHTSRFLSIYIFTLPLTLLPALGTLTIPVTSFFCWGLFSIEEIGHDIENPFDKARREGLLSVDSIVKRIERDVREIFSCPHYYIE